MKFTTISYMAFSFLIVSLGSLTACQRQEPSKPSSTKVSTPVAVIQTPESAVIPPTTTPTSVVDNLAIKDLLDQVVRPDIPSMTFDQVKALFPKTCVANNEERSVSCPNIQGLVSVSYSGGPDGIFDMVFTGGMASYKTLKILISKKFGKGEEGGAVTDSNAAVGIIWWEINPQRKKYSASLGKLKGNDEVALQIAAEQGP